MEDTFRNWGNAIRSRFDVSVFLMKYLEPQNYILLVIGSISLILSVLNITLEWLEERSFVTTTFILSFITILIGIIKPVLKTFKSPSAILIDDSSYSKIVHSVQLDSAQRNLYNFFKIDNFSSEYVVRSERIDSLFRKYDYEIHIIRDELRKINRTLKINHAHYSEILLYKYAKMRNSIPPKKFVNETKLSLKGDIQLDSKNLQIYKSTYFHSFLTNELFEKFLKPIDSHPDKVYKGIDFFPVYSGNIFKPLCDSNLSNHIGASTVAVSDDNFIVLWVQSNKADQSEGLLAPTGSGSCDWQDRLKKITFKEIISHSMERELREESLTKRVSRNTKISTIITGYFRWVRRGGKPEFVGISKVYTNLENFRPFKGEVEDPSYIRTTYPAGNADELKDSLEKLLADELLSVPLHINVISVLETLNEDSEIIEHLLWD